MGTQNVPTSYILLSNEKKNFLFKSFTYLELWEMLSSPGALVDDGEDE